MTCGSSYTKFRTLPAISLIVVGSTGRRPPSSQPVPLATDAAGRPRPYGRGCAQGRIAGRVDGSTAAVSVISCAQDCKTRAIPYGWVGYAWGIRSTFATIDVAYRPLHAIIDSSIGPTAAYVICTPNMPTWPQRPKSFPRQSVTRYDILSLQSSALII